jgi:putative ABC transport system substrate-binding protein
MRRRTVLIVACLLVLACAPSASAQQSKKVWRLGLLHPGSWEVSGDAAMFAAFRQQMSDLGYVEGRNLVMDKRAAEFQIERLSGLASDIVALHPDAIIAVATPAVAAAQRATSTIPIVMTPALDPVRSGFVKNLARPGGNITGLSNMFGDLAGKSVEILHEFLPNAKRVAVLMSTNPAHPAVYETAEAAAHSVGLFTVPVRAATPADLERAFQDIAEANCDALLVLADPIRPAIVSLATRARLPAVYQVNEFVEAGGLVSYGPSLPAMFRKSAQYVDRILKGASPAELPVEQPTTFELVLNLRSAKSLGLSIPESLVVRADKVIE